VSAGATLEDKRVLAEAKYWERVRKARTDFPTFAEMVVKDDMGEAIEYAPMHLAWCWHLTYCWNRRLHCVILSPLRQSGKSSGFAVPLTTWLLGDGTPRLASSSSATGTPGPASG
jgi:hypothetical protein